MTRKTATNSKRKPAGRGLAEFQPLRPAELKLLKACRLGEAAVIGEAKPQEMRVDNCIRAGFLRFLALGGDEQAPVHEHGVQVSGAWIEGVLDLQAARVPSNLFISDCCFGAEPILQDARIAGMFNLGGSQLPGLCADRLRCDGSLFLRNGFAAKGEVRLLGAQIGGDLACGGAKFEVEQGDVLSVDGAVVKGSVFFKNGFAAKGSVRLLGAQIGRNLACGGATFEVEEGAALLADRVVVKGGVFLNNRFAAKGEVRLLGAEIGGNLACSGATFEVDEGDALSADRVVVKGGVFLNNGFAAKGSVRLLGAEIGGDLDCDGAKFEVEEGAALSADGMIVEGSFFFRGLTEPAKRVSLAASHVGRLVDEEASWGEGLILDGFSYGAIAGGAPTDAASRCRWLGKQRDGHYGRSKEGKDFRPQPWQQLIRILRHMGHADEARQIAIAREQHLRRIGLIGQAPPQWNKLKATIYRCIVCAFHWLFGKLIAYGHRPIRLFILMLLVWFSFGVFYWFAAQLAVFAPSNPLVFDHPYYDHCRPVAQGRSNRPVPGNWFHCPELAGEYTAFSPMVYSLDLILPLVDLQQDRDWAPIVPTPKPVWHEELVTLGLNHVTRWLVWFEIMFGWVGSLLLVAVLTGLTNRDRE